MEAAKDSVRSLFFLYRTELKAVFPDQETDQILCLLFEAWMGWSKAKIHLEMDASVPGAEMKNFLKALEELKTGKPVQYIIGMVSFADVHLKVAPGVLIPRPETEELVEWIYRDHKQLQYRDFSLLDIGTGSGCIPISLAKRFPELVATGIDISESALKIAAENADTSHCKVIFQQADILSIDSWHHFGTFDIIVSNPPYIPEDEKRMMAKNVLGFEPHSALFVPDKDPLKFYRAIVAFAIIHLARPGFLYFEIHEKYGKPVRELLQTAGYEKVVIGKDFHGKDRYARAEMRLSMTDQSYWHVEH